MTKINSKDGTSKLLTKTELELMTILWRISEGTVAEVIEELPAGRDLAYTSVSTILRILEQKSIVETRKEGRSHTYKPTVSKNDYEAKMVKHVVERVFEGLPVALVRQLLGAVDLSENDLDELSSLIDQARPKK